MDHERGKDPTPQGREPHIRPHPPEAEPGTGESAKYEHSAPGPEVRKDGVYFFGYKQEDVQGGTADE